MIFESELRLTIQKLFSPFSLMAKEEMLKMPNVHSPAFPTVGHVNQSRPIRYHKKLLGASGKDFPS